MANRIVIRRGDKEDADLVTFENGEPVWAIDSTTNHKFFIMGDGVTAGGLPLVELDENDNVVIDGGTF